LFKILEDCRVLVFLVVLWCLCLSKTSFAARADEFNSDLDESFSAGYSQKSFAQSFHSTAFDEPVEETNKESWETWRFFKGFNFSTTYDSNIFLSRINQKDDESLIYTPTIGFARKGRYDYFQTFYDLSYVEYIENGKLSRFNHSIISQFGYYFPKLKIGVYNTFRPDTAYSIGERTELRSAEASRVIAYSDNALGKIDYELTSKVRLLYKQRYILFYFPTSSNNSIINKFSSQTHIFNPRISYRMAPKTDIYADYEFDTADFFEGGVYSSKSHVASVGITNQILPKTSVTLELGYRWRDYNNNDAAQDEGAYQFKAAASQQLTHKTSITLWATRDFEEDLDNITSTLSANRVVYYYGANLTWQISRHVDFQSGMSIGYATKDGYLMQTDPDNSSLSFTRRLNNDFYESNVSLNWNPRPFVSATVGYKYFKKDSSFKNFDYDDHKVITSLKFKF